MNSERRMDMKMLLDDIEQVVVGHVVDRFAAGDGHNFSFNFEYRLAVGELHVETVS